MSEDLPSCLQACGLEKGWLNILKQNGIETLEDLQSRINDVDDLYAVLEKEAHGEENDALRSFLSKDTLQKAKEQAFNIYLKDNGLDPLRSSPLFAEEGILTLEDFHKFTGNLEKYVKIVEGMNDVETIVVMQMMEITPWAAAEEEIKCLLNRMGFESKYWFPIFKDKVSISHPLMFEYIDSSDCQILKSNIRVENEIKIIEQCFENDCDGTFLERRQNDKKKHKKRIQEIQRILSEIQELCNERDKRVGEGGNEVLTKRNQILEDLEMKVRLENARILLQVPRTELTKSSTSVPLMLEMLKQQMQKMNLQNVLNDDVKDKDVVETASSGLALQGIYLTAENEARLMPRKRVLVTPSEFCLSEPTLPLKNCTDQFSSLNQQEFLTALKCNGYSIAVSDRVENEVSLYNVSKDQAPIEKHSGYAQLRYIVLPIAGGTFDLRNLVLSEDALRELKKLEELAQTLPRDLLYKKCEDFFNEFGTHVNIGMIHFGGIYLWRLNYEGQFTGQKEILSKMADDAMVEFVSSECQNSNKDNFSASDLSDNFRRKYSEFDVENITMTVEIIGGPLNTSSFPQWKSGLLGDNSSWAVIDRGFNVKGIWELIEHQDQYFDNAIELTEILRSTWEAKTGLKAGQLPNSKHLVEVPQRIRELCSFVKTCISDSVFSKNCVSYLESINFEKDQITLISRIPNLWGSIIEENPCIPNFFEVVVQNKDNFSELDVASIKFLVEHLLQGINLNLLSAKDEIMQWTTTDRSMSISEMPISEDVVLHIVSFVKKHIIHKLNKVTTVVGNVQSSVDERCINVTNDFAMYISGVLENIHASGEHHMANLITLMLMYLGYDIQSRQFFVWLSSQNVQKLLENLMEKRKEFMTQRNQGANKIELYLLHVASEVKKGCPAKLMGEAKFTEMIHHMKSHFSMQVKDILDQYEERHEQWDELESFVQSVLFGTPIDDMNQNALGTGLEKVVQVTSAATQVSEATQMYQNTKAVGKQLNNNISDDNILEKLGLSKYYDSKITLQDVMQTSSEKLDTMHDIPWYVIHKLFMLDYRGRNANYIPNDMNKESEVLESKVGIQENNDSSEDFVVDMFTKIMDLSAAATNTVMPHPLDVLVAIFLCSSNFLRQILAQKMYMCHVSIPILLPDTNSDQLMYLIWTLRSIVCECEASDGTAVETSIVSYSLPIVSFIRLGEVSRSKSKLLNDVISNQGHNTFFHRDCVSGIMYPDISEGLADVAWLLPSKQSDSKLNEAITFINLHGNGNLSIRQCHFLIRISNVVVVMVCVEELQNSDTLSVIKAIMKSGKQLLLIISKNSVTQIGNFKKLCEKFFREVGESLKGHTVIVDFNNNGPKNASEIRNEVFGGIKKCLTGGERITLEESMSIAKIFNIIPDESDPECIAGQVFAKEVFNQVNENNLADTKVKMLPLQGDLWHKWGKLDKMENRKEEKVHCSEHYAAELHEKKHAIRRQQLLLCNNPSRLLESFLLKLLRLEGSMKLYFLRWLSIYFDGTSRKALPGLIKEYSKKWLKISQYKSKQKESSDPYMLALQDELCKLEEKLAMTSLGLEHLMREVGQAYEAVTSLPEQVSPTLRNSIHNLPRVMAELMLSGYPLEIMDGDVSHVPLLWVTAVLSELKMLIGDKMIFVLSILGVQSSGKSTLLNTMFGLQFAVSAGRCTRGVYAQLVPVPKGLSDTLYDYILVVDTEGLRAPELAATKHQHDNELATLVIGLGDMTMINIKGENPTEMQDVLQIAVHAFLRMQLVNKNLKLQPSCFFIHQNVGAVNAAGKMIFGQQKLQDNLDKMTAAAADQENVRGIYSFKEVIDFDVEKNVWYFSDLWQGDPPMAPTNPGYSEKVHQVKMSLLKDIMQKKKSRSKLSSICIRIKDLWKGILAENFVFSFKNSLELRAYNSLESTIADLSWSLQNDALKWLNDVRNRILSCENEINLLEVKLTQEFITYFEITFDEAQKKLLLFFEESDDKDMIEQWKENTMLKLKNVKEETKATTLQGMKNEFEIHRLGLQQVKDVENYKEDLQTRAKKLAVELQDKKNITEEELEAKFNNLWTGWIKNLPRNYLHDKSNDIEVIVDSVLFERLHSDRRLLEGELSKTSISDPIHEIQNFEVSKNHIHQKKKYFVISIDSTEQCLKMATKEVKNLFEKIEEDMNSLQGSNFCQTQAVNVIKKTCDMVKEVNSSEASFKFTADFKVYLVIHVCRYAVATFKKIHYDYLKQIDPRTTMENNYREQLFKLFKNIYKKSKNEKTVADMLSTCLMDAINKAVEGDMSRELANDVRHNVPSLHSKGNLLNSILRDLLILESFEEYMLYLSNIEACLMKWVYIYTNRYVFENRRSGISRYAELASFKIQSLIQYIFKEVENATNRVGPIQDFHQDNKHKKRPFQLWLEIFHEGLKTKLPLPESSFSLITKEGIDDLKFFTEIVINNLTSNQQNLEMKARSVDKRHLKTKRNSVYNLLERECLGCMAQCPFCRAPCSLTISGHDVEHSALQHYPQGCGGYHNSVSQKLVIETCSSCVSGDGRFKNNDTQGDYHPYKDYKKYYPDWKIQADASMESSLYWKWFMAKFAIKLAKEFGVNEPDIPHAWTCITPREAEASLE